MGLWGTDVKTYEDLTAERLERHRREGVLAAAIAWMSDFDTVGASWDPGRLVRRALIARELLEDELRESQNRGN